MPADPLHNPRYCLKPPARRWRGLVGGMLSELLNLNPLSGLTVAAYILYLFASKRKKVLIKSNKQFDHEMMAQLF